MHQKYIEKLFDKLTHTVFYDGDNRITKYEDGFECLVKMFRILKKDGKRIFFIGNGGSAAIASHQVNDFMKNGGMKAYSLLNPSLITCLANDLGYENIYSKQVEQLVEAGDVLVAISSSGNSSNIIRAVEVAQKKEVKVVTFTGFKEQNLLKHMGDFNVYVPIEHYGIVESIHSIILQQIVDTLMVFDSVN